MGKHKRAVCSLPTTRCRISGQKSPSTIWNFVVPAGVSCVFPLFSPVSVCVCLVAEDWVTFDSCFLLGMDDSSSV